MRTRKRYSVRSLGFLVLVSALTLCLAPSAHVQKETVKVSTTTGQGLHIVTFDAFHDRVIVNLPDDMKSGNTISGSVVPETKRNTDEERAKNDAIPGPEECPKDATLSAIGSILYDADSPLLKDPNAQFLNYLWVCESKAIPNLDDACKAYCKAGDCDFQYNSLATVEYLYGKDWTSEPPQRTEEEKGISAGKKGVRIACRVAGPCHCFGKLARSGSDSDQLGGLATAKVETARGLHTVTFDTIHGNVIVNLPDDMMAGDTISGTVIAEPKGRTDTERFRDVAMLDGYVVDFVWAKSTSQTDKASVALGSGSYKKGEAMSLDELKRIWESKERGHSFKLTLPKSDANAPNQNSLKINLTEYLLGADKVPTERVITTATVPIIPTVEMHLTTPLNSSQLPTLGQQGRPIEILRSGGSSQSPTLNWTKVRSTVQDFEKNTENVSGGFGLIDGSPIAASPRKAVFICPTNVTGLIEIALKEGDTETKGTFRNVGVNLSAPKTNLLKGEHTTLRVQISGLEGLKEPVPLTLESHGVITMEGGMYQQLMIQPSQVNKDGQYTTTRGATGVQTGEWGATATVVTQPFNVCLQDDNNAQIVLLINSYTGVYTFSCPGCSPANQTSGPPAKGTVTMNGCTINLQDNAPDRHVKAQIDQCAKTGSASVQTSSPKMKFTITDRDMTNNTCVCGPGCK